jgi:hypothetical protein
VKIAGKSASISNDQDDEAPKKKVSKNKKKPVSKKKNQG